MSLQGFFSEDDKTLEDETLEGDKKRNSWYIPQMPSLEDDEEEFADIQPIALLDEKALKILTQNKLLTRLPILFAQIKARNNSY